MKHRADKDRLITQFISLAREDSISFHEVGVCWQLKNRLLDMDFEIYEDEAGARYESECGNLYGYLKGTADREPILLSAHMDTVEPGTGKRPVLNKKSITSDGSTVLGADDVCGIVEILEGIRLAKQSPTGHGDIEVLFTIGEEQYGKGSKVFDYSRIRSKQACVMDLSGAPGIAARKAPSIISFEARIRGKAAHAGFAPDAGINALQAAAKAVASIPQGRISENLTVNIGKMESGTANNVIPEFCTCSGEVRGFDHDEALEEVARIEEIFRDAAAKAGAETEFKRTVHIKAYETPADAEICQCFQRACADTGLPGELVETHGGSDNNIFAQQGIEGIVASCGMYQTHSTSEYTTPADLTKGAELVSAIILQQPPKGE